MNHLTRTLLLVLLALSLLGASIMIIDPPAASATDQVPGSDGATRVDAMWPYVEPEARALIPDLSSDEAGYDGSNWAVIDAGSLDVRSSSFDPSAHAEAVLATIDAAIDAGSLDVRSSSFDPSAHAEAVLATIDAAIDAGSLDVRSSSLNPPVHIDAVLLNLAAEARLRARPTIEPFLLSLASQLATAADPSLTTTDAMWATVDAGSFDTIHRVVPVRGGDASGIEVARRLVDAGLIPSSRPRQHSQPAPSALPPTLLPGGGPQ